MRLPPKSTPADNIPSSDKYLTFPERTLSGVFSPFKLVLYVLSWSRLGAAMSQETYRVKNLALVGQGGAGKTMLA